MGQNTKTVTDQSFQADVLGSSVLRPGWGGEIVHSLRKRGVSVNPLVAGSSPAGPTMHFAV